MICIQCGHSQETGKFCGKCGTRFEGSTSGVPVNLEHVTATETIAQAQLEPNVHVEKLKAQSKMYGSYFMQQLKKPSRSFQEGQEEFTNALISIILFCVLTAGAIYTMIRSVVSGFVEVPFLSTIINNMAFTLVLIALALISLFTINKFFGSQLTLKSIASLYGAHLSLLLVTAAAAFLFMLMKSYTFGNVALALTVLLAIFILPLYLISTLLTQKPTGLDPLYGFFLYLVLFLILFAIFVTIMADSALGQFIGLYREFGF
ncbi:hypothetical protein AB1K83_13195 [Sporosarcina sp. 179-K 3D1 HS]|uniref:hypothetical protein n=1 Tax=Sporosarcina sp. 179-K 3D1 HS TaxID=3232169 RepID=UPI0039A0E138